MSILNISVSGFANYHTTEPKDVNLLAWLRSEKYRDQVMAIRKNADKVERDRLKAVLPAITPGGTFSERKATALITHSGFLQFDIDGVRDITAAKQKVCSLQNVAYCGLSVSGRGLWGLIPIAEPAHHKQYFEFIQKAFASMGIILDPACKDVARLRGYSYDPDAYFNHNAKPLNRFYSRPKPVPRKTHFKAITGNYETKRIEYCLSELNARKIDLTHHYSNWFALGCSFSSLGEGGRQYFHIASQNYPGYDPHETDEQFTKCLKTSSTKNLATFFAMCRDAGVHFKDAAPIVEPAPAKPKPLLSISTDDICHIQWINQTGKKFDNLQIVWLKTATENFEVLYNEQGYPVTEYSKTIAQVETEFKKKFTPGLLDGEACFLMKIDKP